MKKERIEELFARLEQIKYEKDLIEYWSARDLQQILEYTKWDTFSEYEDNNMAVRELLIERGVSLKNWNPIRISA